MTKAKSTRPPANAGSLQRPAHLWQRGQSGNPAGRTQGARNRATLAIEALLDGEAEALTRKAIELALAGDMTALRLCLERICPARKSRPVQFALPKVQSPADVLAAISAVVLAVAAGEIDLDEAVTVTSLLEAKRKALEFVEIERRLAALEKGKANGQV